jgi:hypothetical protein
MRGLSADADAIRSDAAHRDEIVEAVRKHYLADKADYGVPNRNITNVEDILWSYERTGDPRLLALAEKAWAEYAALDGKEDVADLQADRVFADTPIDSHGVSYIEIAKQPAILYMYTGKPEYLKFALAAQKRIFDHHMLIDGIPSTSEYYSTLTSQDSHETCDITDHTWSWGYMLMATGDGLWGDRVERACFNAGFGAIKKDWKGVQYFSCPNQFLVPAQPRPRDRLLRRRRSSPLPQLRHSHVDARHQGRPGRHALRSLPRQCHGRQGQPPHRDR